MSHVATTWAIQQRGLRPAVKLLLWHLCDRHNVDYGCFPNQAMLAEDCEMSRASINRYLDELEQVGLIRREQRKDATGKQLSTRYLLAFEEAFDTQDVVSRVSDCDTEPCLKNSENRVSKIAETVSHSSETLTCKGTRNRTSNTAHAVAGDVELDFQQTLWVDFPRHQNSRRLPALKAFSKLSPQDRTACIRGAVAYSLRFENDSADKRPIDERLRYVPHLVTWINQRGWETELEAAR